MMKGYGRAVTRHPWVFISVIVALTLVMGYFASKAEISSSEHDFAPDNEVAVANDKIMEEYGQQADSFTAVLVSEENVLARESMISMLELEEELMGSDVAKAIERTPDNPTGITSPANIIAQSAYFLGSMERIMTIFHGQGSGDDGNNGNKGNDSGNETKYDHRNDAGGDDEHGNRDGTACRSDEGSEGNGSGPEGGESGSAGDSMSGIQRAILGRLFTLTIEERKNIFNGGEVKLNLTAELGMSFNITFEEYTPDILPRYINGSPFGAALPFLLSKDYLERGSQENTARYCIFMLSINKSLDEDDMLEHSNGFLDICGEVSDDHEGLRYRAFAGPLINDAILSASGESMALLMGIAMLLVIIVLGLIYRRVSDTVLNLVSLVMAIIWTYGLGVILGYTFNPILTVVPVLIIGLGIDYGIHLTVRYREEVNNGEPVSASLVTSISFVGFALLLATITTIMGFLSNLTAQLEALRQFGILCAAGIVAAFVIMISFTPAVKCITDGRRERLGKLKRRKGGNDRSSGRNDIGVEVDGGDRKGLRRRFDLGRFSSRHPILIIVVVLLLTGGALTGSLRLKSRFDFRDFLPEDMEMTETLNIFFDEFNFSQEETYVLIEGDVASPDVFLAIREVEDIINGSEYRVSSESVRSPLQLAKQLSDQNERRYDPEVGETWVEHIDRNGDGDPDPEITRENVTALYDALMKDPSNQAAFVLHATDGKYDGIVVRAQVNSRNSQKNAEITEDMERAGEPMDRFLGGELDRVISTGGPIVVHVIMTSINENQVRSIIITMVISLAILTTLYLVLRKSLLLGLVTILPLIFVLIWGTGTMYYVDIPLNVVTVTIGALTIGLGVTYGIHLTQRFLEDMDRYDDAEKALSVSVRHTGKALFGAAATTVVGFGIISLSILPPLAQFGIITAISITYSFLASVFVLPAFLSLWYRAREKVWKML